MNVDTDLEAEVLRWRVRRDTGAAWVPWDPRAEWLSLERDAALHGHDHAGPLLFQPSRPDQPVSLYAVLAAARQGSHAWRLELLGAPWTPVDRQYLVSDRSAVLLTGYGWCLRLLLRVRRGRREPAPYRFRTWLERVPTLPWEVLGEVDVPDIRPLTDADRSVLWTYYEPDAPAIRRLFDHGFDPSTTAGLIFTLPHSPCTVPEGSHHRQPVRVPKESRVVSLFQPRWLECAGGACPGWTRVRLDPRMRQVEISTGAARGFALTGP